MNPKIQNPEIIHPWVAAEGLGDPQLTELLVLQDGIYKEVLNSNIGTMNLEHDERVAAMDALRYGIRTRQKELGINPIDTVYTVDGNQ